MVTLDWHQMAQNKPSTVSEHLINFAISLQDCDVVARPYAFYIHMYTCYCVFLDELEN